MEQSDRVVVLNLGTKLAEGLPEEIQRNAAVRDAYLGETLDTVRSERSAPVEAGAPTATEESPPPGQPSDSSDPGDASTPTDASDPADPTSAE
jgi:uncharacterized membrane protein